MAKKLTKEEIKGPDAFIAVTDKIIAWIEEHSKTIVSIVGGFALLGAGFMGAKQWENYKESNHQSALYEIEALANTKTEELAKDEKYKYEDVEKDYGEILRRYQVFAKEHQGSKAAYIANINSVDILRKYKEYDRARELLASATAQLADTDFFFGLLHMQLAIVEINLKRFKEATSTLKKILDNNNQVHFHAQSLLSLGLCHQNLNELTEAKSYYDRLESEFGETEAAQSAKTYSRFMQLKSDTAVMNEKSE